MKKTSACIALLLMMGTAYLQTAEAPLAEAPLFRCEVCTKTFSDLKKYTRHTNYHQKEKIYGCPECDSSFISPSALEKHLTYHSEERPFKCKHLGCLTACKNKNDFHQHMVAAHQSLAPLEALTAVASIAYVTASADTTTPEGATEPVSPHHTNAQPTEEPAADEDAQKPVVGFYCAHCDNAFATSKEYRFHAQQNKLPLELVCSSCKKTFDHGFVLSKHFRTHTGERPYPCPTCPKSFADFSTLRNHTLIHTGEKPHACSGCNKTYRQIGQLKTHKEKCDSLNVPALIPGSINLASLMPDPLSPAPASLNGAHASLFHAQEASEDNDDEPLDEPLKEAQAAKRVRVAVITPALQKSVTK